DLVPDHAGEQGAQRAYAQAGPVEQGLGRARQQPGGNAQGESEQAGDVGGFRLEAEGYRLPARPPGAEQGRHPYAQQQEADGAAEDLVPGQNRQDQQDDHRRQAVAHAQEAAEQGCALVGAAPEVVQQVVAAQRQQRNGRDQAQAAPAMDGGQQEQAQEYSGHRTV